ncbi:MAG: hypothetical protein IPL53_09395 [Ignavibacteria bacterium]|nr:hypothetical protein [Ignavibacteria bacterium]
MEHQSAVAYGNKYRFGILGHGQVIDRSRNENSIYMIVHESAHEWFGNNITTNDIADMWVRNRLQITAKLFFFSEYWYDKDAANEYNKGMRELITNKIPVVRIR